MKTIQMKGELVLDHTFSSGFTVCEFCRTTKDDYHLSTIFHLQSVNYYYENDKVIHFDQEEYNRIQSNPYLIERALSHPNALYAYPKPFGHTQIHIHGTYDIFWSTPQRHSLIGESLTSIMVDEDTQRVQINFASGAKIQTSVCRYFSLLEDALEKDQKWERFIF